MSVGRRLREVALEDLPDLPDPCGRCTFWQRSSGAPREGDPAAKEAWWQAAQLEWGSPGRAIVRDGAVVAFAVFGPPSHFPRIRRFGAAVGDDALLLASLWVEPEHRREGTAKTLLQACLRDVHRHGAKALESFGARTDAAPACLIPEGFLLANGFSVVHEDDAAPLLRLDLRTTARWTESVGHALEGVRSALARREPAPSSVTSR